MMNNKPYTMDSFGSDCPENWEEICNLLNDYAEAHPEEDANDIWEKYWRGELAQEERKGMKVTNKAGTKIDFAASVNYMDDDIREDLNASLAPCSEQDFFTAYEEAHIETFGEEWELSKENPVW